jgi:hypothetical protein
MSNSKQKSKVIDSKNYIRLSDEQKLLLKHYFKLTYCIDLFDCEIHDIELILNDINPNLPF